VAGGRGGEGERRTDKTMLCAYVQYDHLEVSLSGFFFKVN
jgi:hypothetical protein